MTLYFLCLMLFCVGLYGVLRKRNIIKMIVGLGIMGYAMNLFFVLL
ncbi:MAG: NADH-quinone oxidoreductase subunit K, partial [Candidatus Omnitrophota bacterium]|nr:NADH-quinone oxidoreductase subunit K [Candidatus Omnitrophota bacterium]